jgi:predicted AAA+ superfamily ATPase
MAITNLERIGKAMELLKEGLRPFVEREMKTRHAQGWFEQVKASVREVQPGLFGTEDDPRWDVAMILAVMWNQWQLVFRNTLGQAERTLVSELREVRNRWAHQQPFSSDDAYRALDSAARLLTAVSAPQAEELEKMKLELLRLRFDEQVRSEKRKTAGGVIESIAAGTLKPWREVVTSHQDVAKGTYQQAEFAADLWQVHLGQGTAEYRDPGEFFRRTFLTESLKQLLANAIERVSGKGGDPVVQLQTNFGGGKTHSMLALYHLFSGVNPAGLSGIEQVMKDTGIAKLPKVNRVVLVGNRISPGNPEKKADGTIVRTLWGEIAYQLGGKKAFERVRADDERATSPGDTLRKLFVEYGPCLILIDEWVAYARQLHEESDLPGGSFETQFTFAQALTESAKVAKNCLLVISLPASDSGGSPHTISEDVEVGGQRGREALDRLRNVVGRLESSWRPATPEEGFEIVRRRLFEPMADPAQFKDRDVSARAFGDFYRKEQSEFPTECRNTDYEKRIVAAYPIHPEIFDRLYGDWSTLIKFQRTRGVLRLMAAVIHSLWEKGDRNPLIMPANIPLDDARVQWELKRYLSDNWDPILEKDIDGPGSLPLKLDAEIPNLGKLSACRRVARTIYLGSAPTSNAANRGLEDRRIKLGSAMPGESPNIFGDALRRLAAAATFLYQDGPRYWYSVHPTVTKLADDRAEEYKGDPAKAVKELETRLRADLRAMGDFKRVHPLPPSSADVPDDYDARLVVLGIEQAYSKEADNAGEGAAKAILAMRGTTPRLYANALVFLAPDKTRWQDLDEAIRKYLAWKSILDEQDKLDLSRSQRSQAEAQYKGANDTVIARLPETYQWLLVPEQKDPQSAVAWQAIRLTGQDPLAQRTSAKLRKEELMLWSYAASLLRMQMDRVPLWRDGAHVSIRQLVEDFARYLYLPRLRSPEVLLKAIEAGLELLTWRQDSFAYAESYDETARRYRGLRAPAQLRLDADDSGLLVKPEIAWQQIQQESATKPTDGAGHVDGPVIDNPDGTTSGTPRPVEKEQPRRYHGTVTLDPERVGRDASKIADEIVTHLVGLLGASVRVTLEINAEIPAGVPENVVRIVTENGRELKFAASSGFESK